MLLGLSKQIGQDASAESANLADHATGDCCSEGPAQRDELEGGSVACTECGEAKHEEQCSCEERGRGHEAEEAGNRN
jgi:hypothetical protein